ncbi:MAG: penicillin-binding protein 2 [Pseudomonadota bacterium]
MKRELTETEALRTGTFNRRALLLGGLQLAAFAALGGRLYQLSVVDGERYRTLADDNRLSLRFLAPLRGRILDHQGRELASNKRNFSIVVVPEQVKDLRATLAALSKVIELSPAQRELVIARAKRQRSFLPIRVKGNLEWDEFARFNASAPHFPGVLPAAGTARVYPHGSDAAHVLGYVGAVSQADMNDDPVLSLPGFKVGREGIERRFESQLRGNTGTRRVEVNARGRVVRQVAREDAQAGQDVTLTIDQRLQSFTAKRCGEDSAGVVVLDVNSGEIRALVSTPAHDPNEFVNGISRTNWAALLADPRKPLLNKTLSGQYPPGSTFKMIVALAALEAGLIDENTTHQCDGRFELGDQRFHCWKKGGHGEVNLTQAMAQSCDVFFYELGEALGHARIAEMARRFGLGDTFSLPIAGEQKGLIPSPEWKQRARKTAWVGGDTINMSIGQGALLATPLQLATMTARIANGGYTVTPTLLPVDPDQLAANADEANRIVAPAAIEMIKASMVEAVHGQFGTARASALPQTLGKMGGKTGTAQVRRISEQERESGILDNEELAWKQRDHALFVGYAPHDKPRYAISVLVQHGGGGSTVAAPIASDILAEALSLDLIDQRQASLVPPVKKGGA